VDAVRGYAIGQLAAQTGCKVQTIRYYETIGLLPAPERTAGNQRVYPKRTLDRLSFIRHARELGFSLDAIRELLALTDQPEQSCESADLIARSQLGDVRSRIARLRGLEAELQRMVALCARGRVAECRVIEVLADQSHAHCLTRGHGLEAEALEDPQSGRRVRQRAGRRE